MRTRSLLASSVTLALVGGLYAGTAETAVADPAPVRATGPAAAAAAAPDLPIVQKGRGGKVSWDSTSFAPGGPGVVAHGKLRGKGKRKLALQVRTKGSWESFGKTRTDRKGNFAIQAPLDWYGTHKVRLTTKGKRSGFSKKTTVTVATPYTPRGATSAYSFLWKDDQNLKTAWRFNPCKTLTYAVNYSEVGEPALALAQQAMTQMSWATGIEVKYVGTTTNVPHRIYPDAEPNPPGVDLVIAWGSFAEVPSFQQQNKAGWGGPSKGKWARDARGRKVIESQTAAVTIATEYYQKGFAPAFDSTQPTMGEVLLHEIGHSMGLDHVEANPEEIMNGATYLPWADGHYRGLYSYGDLEGLRQLGLDSGCLSKYRGRANRQSVQAPPPVA